jgi:hypothetical protein
MGNASKGGMKVPPSLMTLIDFKNQEQQGNWIQHFLFKAPAPALHYCGLEHAASHFSSTPQT